MIKKIHTNNAPKAVGPYSQAVKTYDLVFCSGQIGINPDTNEMVEGVEKQAKQVMKNIKAVLKEAGTELKQIVKATIFLKDLANYDIVNEVYGSYFTEHLPARSTVQVARLPKDAEVEIEVIAMVDMFAEEEGCCGDGCGCSEENKDGGCCASKDGGSCCGDDKDGCCCDDKEEKCCSNEKEVDCCGGDKNGSCCKDTK